MTADAHLALDRRARTACSRMSVCFRHPQRVNSRNVTPIRRADGEPDLLRDVFNELHNFRLTTGLPCFTREQWYVPLYSRVRELGSLLVRLRSESTVRAWLCELISTKTDQSSEFAKRLRIYFRVGMFHAACLRARWDATCVRPARCSRTQRKEQATNKSPSNVRPGCHGIHNTSALQTSRNDHQRKSRTRRANATRHTCRGFADRVQKLISPRKSLRHVLLLGSAKRGW